MFAVLSSPIHTLSTDVEGVGNGKGGVDLRDRKFDWEKNQVPFFRGLDLLGLLQFRVGEPPPVPSQISRLW